MKDGLLPPGDPGVSLSSSPRAGRGWRERLGDSALLQYGQGAARGGWRVWCSRMHTSGWAACTKASQACCATAGLCRSLAGPEWPPSACWHQPQSSPILSVRLPATEACEQSTVPHLRTLVVCFIAAPPALLCPASARLAAGGGSGGGLEATCHCGDLHASARLLLLAELPRPDGAARGVRRARCGPLQCLDSSG